jgi:hypothetical protein
MVLETIHAFQLPTAQGPTLACFPFARPRLACPWHWRASSRAGATTRRSRRSPGPPGLTDIPFFRELAQSAYGKRAPRRKVEGRATGRQLQGPLRQARNQASTGYLPEHLGKLIPEMHFDGGQPGSRPFALSTAAAAGVVRNLMNASAAFGSLAAAPTAAG